MPWPAIGPQQPRRPFGQRQKLLELPWQRRAKGKPTGSLRKMGCAEQPLASPPVLPLVSDALNPSLTLCSDQLEVTEGWFIQAPKTAQRRVSLLMEQPCQGLGEIGLGAGTRTETQTCMLRLGLGSGGLRVRSPTPPPPPAKPLSSLR